MMTVRTPRVSSTDAMTENERPFTGFVVSGEPVTTQKAREAGIIKKSKVTDKPEQPIKTENDEQTEV